MTSEVRPLEGIKVVEFSHMVLGPSCGLILADLGADVVKVCLLYTSPSPRDKRQSRMPSSA